MARIGWATGLERVPDLLRRLGNPQNNVHFGYITGTGGKESVSAVLSAVLTAANQVVGLYTFRHLLRVNERIKINDTDILSVAARPAGASGRRT